MRAWRPAACGVALVVATGLVVGILGCRATDPAAPWTERDSAGVRIVSNHAPRESWSLAAEPVFALGESGDTSALEFFQVRAIAPLPDGRFAVANAGTEQVRIFDPDGRLLAEVGGKGNGPDEFSVLARVWALGDSLLTYDYRNDRVTVRDASGALARSFRLEWFSGGLEPVVALRDRTLLATTTRRLGEIEGSGVILDSALVSRYDLEGRRIDTIARVPHNQRVLFTSGNGQTVLGLPFAATGSFAAGADGFCYAFGTTASLPCFSNDGVPVLRVELDRAGRAVLPEHTDAFWDTRLGEVNPIQAQILRRHREDMIFPDSFPAFESLLADDAGRTWAQVYPLPGDPELEWLVFESGRWIARLAVPAAFEIMTVSGDRVLGVWRDELGVESVRAYQIEGS